MTVHKHFAPPPFTPQKKISAPFLPWKLWVRKACKLNFHWKVCGNFFSRPKILSQSPLFCIRPLLTSVCEQSLKAPGKMSNQNISLTKTTVLWDFQYISLKKDVYLCLSCVFVYILLRSAVSCFTFNFCVLLWNFIRRILSSWRMFLSRIIHCLHFRQPGRHFVHPHSLLSREIIRKSIMSCLHFRINVFQF